MLHFHIHSYVCTVLFIHVQHVVHLKFPDDVMPSITRILAIILYCKMNGSVGAAECPSLYLPDREASLIKKESCRCEPHPLQVISSRARPYLLRERAALAPFSRNSGVGHSGL